MQRGMTTYTTPRAAIISVLLCAALLALAFLGAAFPAVNVVTVAHSAMPFFLMLTGLIAGFIPMGLCLLFTLGALAFAGGAPLLLYGAMYLLPVTAAFAYSVTRRVRFWRACALVTGALFVSQLVIYLVLSRLTAGDLYVRAAKAVSDAIEALPVRDSLLYTFYQAGFLTLPESMLKTAVVPSADGAGYVFAAEALAELLKQVRSVVTALLSGLMPALLVSGSATTGVLGVALSLHFGRSAARKRAFKRDEPLQDIPSLDMPAFSTWHIPRPWGLRIGLLAIGYPLMSLGVNGALAMAGALMWQAFSVCYAMQGAATINFTQKKRGTRKGWRVLVLVLACLLPPFQSALIIVGAVDQFSNIRGLRPAPAHKNE